MNGGKKLPEVSCDISTFHSLTVWSSEVLANKPLGGKQEQKQTINDKYYLLKRRRIMRE